MEMLTLWKEGESANAETMMSTSFVIGAVPARAWDLHVPLIAIINKKAPYSSQGFGREAISTLQHIKLTVSWSF